MSRTKVTAFVKYIWDTTQNVSDLFDKLNNYCFIHYFSADFFNIQTTKLF